MGPCVSMPDDDINELLQNTHFTKKILKRWKKKFMKDNPVGMLTEKQFIEVYEQMYATTFSNHLVSHIFHSIDTNNDGMISFKELVSALAVITGENMRKKLEWAFKVYDVDGNGQITVDELWHMVVCVQGSRRGRPASFNKHFGPFRCKEEVEDMFKDIDTDSNGFWSVDEFVAAMDKHVLFAKMLETVALPIPVPK